MDTIEKLKHQLVGVRLAQNGAKLAELAERIEGLPDKKEPHSTYSSAGDEVTKRAKEMQRVQGFASFADGYIDEHFAPYGQGLVSMAPALRATEAAILEQRIAHGNDPVLAWCVTNAIAEVADHAGNLRLTKRKSVGRIDALVATVMGIGVSSLEREISPIEFSDNISDHVGRPLAASQVSYW